MEILSSFNKPNYLSHIYIKSRMSLNVIHANIQHLLRENLIEFVKSDNRTKKCIITPRGREFLLNLKIIEINTRLT